MTTEQLRDRRRERANRPDPMIASALDEEFHRMADERHQNYMRRSAQRKEDEKIFARAVMAGYIFVIVGVLILFWMFS